MADFIRRAELTVGGTEVRGLRLRFNIVRSATSTVDTSTIEVFNLSSNVFSNFARGDLVSLRGGYDDQGELEVIFTGRLINLTSTKRNVDSITTLYVGDRTMLEQEVETTYEGEVPVVEILRDLLDGFFDVDYSVIANAIRNAVLARTVSNFVADGNTRYAVNALLDEAQEPDSEASVSVNVTNGLVSFHVDGSYDSGSVVLVSEATGMIGSPQRIFGLTSGVRVRMRLATTPVLGGAVDVQSARTPTANGRRKIVKITHSGGTGGRDEWQTEIEAHDVEDA